MAVSRARGAGASWRLAFAAAASLLAAGCIAPTEPLPKDERRGDPQDGEIAVYDVTTRDGTVIGRSATGYRVRGAEVDLLRGKPAAVLAASPTESDPALEGELVLDAEGPLRTWRGAGEKRVETTWDRARGVIVLDRKGTKEEIAVPAGVRDNDELLEALRRAALEPGAPRRIALFNAGMGLWIPADIAPLDETTIVTPLGEHRAVDVRLGFGTTYHHVFFEVAPPHRILRYDNQGGTRLVLRSFRSSRTDPAPIEVAEPPPPKAALKAPMLAAILLVQWPLMLGLPLLVAFRMKRRLGLPFGIWGLGALGFILSQVVHLPLNWALGLMGSPRWLGMATPPVVAAALGATAGLCEEVTRWLVLRRFAAKGRGGERVGLFAGAGHGGIEAMILGFLASMTTISLLTLHVLPPGWIGVPPEQVPEVARQAAVYWATPWWEPIAGGVERVSAMTFHVGMSVLIAWGIRSGRATLAVTLAVILHAGLDALAVYAAPRIGLAILEGVFLVVAAIVGVLVWRALSKEPTGS